MTRDVAKSPERQILEKSLKRSIKEVINVPFDLEVGVERLADFIEEFKLQEAIKKGKWLWEEMEYSPYSDKKVGLLMVLESEIATSRVCFACRDSRGGDHFNATLEVLPKDAKSAISTTTIGYTTEISGNKGTGCFDIRSTENGDRALTIINFKKFSTYVNKFGVSTWPPISKVLKDWVESLNQNDAWDKCREFVLETSGLLVE